MEIFMKNKNLIFLFVVFMSMAHAQTTGEKDRIRQALIEVQATATHIKSAAGRATQGLKGDYGAIADDIIKAVDALKKAIGDASDPRALQQVAEKTRIAAAETKGLLAFVRANDVEGALEKSKSVTRALEEAEASLRVSPDENAFEEVQEAIGDIQEKEKQVF
jgi:hypothetical protein